MSDHDFTGATPPADFYVYLHRKATTREVFYVGKGEGRRAWRQTGSGRGKYWQNTARKHGLIVEIAAHGLQEWYAHELECALIALHGRRDCGRGPLVNLTDGGEGGSGRIDSEMVREKRSVSVASKYKLDDTYSERVSAALVVAYKNPAYRAKVRATARRLAQDPNYRKKHKAAVQRRSNDAQWRAKNKAAREATYSDPVAQAKVKAAATRRAADPNWIAKNNAANRARRCRAVQCLETGTKFQSAADAVAMLRANGRAKASHSAISACAQGRQKIAYGYTWRYADADPAPLASTAAASA